MSNILRILLDKDQMRNFGANSEFLSKEMLYIDAPQRRWESYKHVLLNSYQLYISLDDFDSLGGRPILSRPILNITLYLTDQILDIKEDPDTWRKVHSVNSKTGYFYSKHLMYFVYNKLKIQLREFKNSQIFNFTVNYIKNNSQINVDFYMSLNEAKDIEYQLKFLKYRIKHDF